MSISFNLPIRSTVVPRQPPAPKDDLARFQDILLESETVAEFRAKLGVEDPYGFLKTEMPHSIATGPVAYFKHLLIPQAQPEIDERCLSDVQLRIPNGKSEHCDLLKYVLFILFHRPPLKWESTFNFTVLRNFMHLRFGSRDVKFEMSSIHSDQFPFRLQLTLPAFAVLTHRFRPQNLQQLPVDQLIETLKNPLLVYRSEEDTTPLELYCFAPHFFSSRSMSSFLSSLPEAVKESLAPLFFEYIEYQFFCSQNFRLMSKEFGAMRKSEQLTVLGNPPFALSSASMSTEREFYHHLLAQRMNSLAKFDPGDSECTRKMRELPYARFFLHELDTAPVFSSEVCASNTWFETLTKTKPKTDPLYLRFQTPDEHKTNLLNTILKTIFQYASDGVSFKFARPVHPFFWLIPHTVDPRLFTEKASLRTSTSNLTQGKKWQFSLADIWECAKTGNLAPIMEFVIALNPFIFLPPASSATQIPAPIPNVAKLPPLPSTSACMVRFEELLASSNDFAEFQAKLKNEKWNPLSVHASLFSQFLQSIYAISAVPAVTPHKEALNYFTHLLIPGANNTTSKDFFNGIQLKVPNATPKQCHFFKNLLYAYYYLIPPGLVVFKIEVLKNLMVKCFGSSEVKFEISSADPHAFPFRLQCTLTSLAVLTSEFVQSTDMEPSQLAELIKDSILVYREGVVEPLELFCFAPHFFEKTKFKSFLDCIPKQVMKKLLPTFEQFIENQAKYAQEFSLISKDFVTERKKDQLLLLSRCPLESSERAAAPVRTIPKETDFYYYLLKTRMDYLGRFEPHDDQCWHKMAALPFARFFLPDMRFQPSNFVEIKQVQGNTAWYNRLVNGAAPIAESWIKTLTLSLRTDDPAKTAVLNSILKNIALYTSEDLLFKFRNSPYTLFWLIPYFLNREIWDLKATLVVDEKPTPLLISLKVIWNSVRHVQIIPTITEFKLARDPWPVEKASAKRALPPPLPSAIQVPLPQPNVVAAIETIPESLKDLNPEELRSVKTLYSKCVENLVNLWIKNAALNVRLVQHLIQAHCIWGFDLKELADIQEQLLSPLKILSSGTRSARQKKIREEILNDISHFLGLNRVDEGRDTLSERMSVQSAQTLLDLKFTQLRVRAAYLEFFLNLDCPERDVPVYLLTQDGKKGRLDFMLGSFDRSNNLTGFYANRDLLCETTLEEVVEGALEIVEGEEAYALLTTEQLTQLQLALQETGNEPPFLVLKRHDLIAAQESEESSPSEQSMEGVQQVSPAAADKRNPEDKEKQVKRKKPEAVEIIESSDAKKASQSSQPKSKNVRAPEYEQQHLYRDLETEDQLLSPPKQPSNTLPKLQPPLPLIVIPPLKTSAEDPVVLNPASLWQQMSLESIKEVHKKCDAQEAKFRAVTASGLTYPAAEKIQELAGPVNVALFPVLNPMLWDFQRVQAFKQLLFAGAGLGRILASKMGLGKTYMYAEIIMQTLLKKGGSALVIAPKQLVGEIADEIRRAYRETQLTAWRVLIAQTQNVDHFYELFIKKYDNGEKLEHFLRIFSFFPLSFTLNHPPRCSELAPTLIPAIAQLLRDHLLFLVDKHADPKRLYKDIAAILLKSCEAIQDPEWNNKVRATLAIPFPQCVENPVFADLCQFSSLNAQLNLVKLHLVGQLLDLTPRGMPSVQPELYDRDRLLASLYNEIPIWTCKKRDELEDALDYPNENGIFVTSIHASANGIDRQFNCLVVDEAHQLRKEEGKFSGILKDLIAKQPTAGIHLVSGTPYENDWKEFWNFLAMGSPGQFPASTCDALTSLLRFIQGSLAQLVRSKAQVPTEELTTQLLTAFGQFRGFQLAISPLIGYLQNEDACVVAEVGNKFPARVEKPIYIDLNPATKKVADQALKEFTPLDPEKLEKQQKKKKRKEDPDAVSSLFGFEQRIKRLFLHPLLDGGSVQEKDPFIKQMNRTLDVAVKEFKEGNLLHAVKEVNDFMQQSSLFGGLFNDPDFAAAFGPGERSLLFVEHISTGFFLEKMIALKFSMAQTRFFYGKINAPPVVAKLKEWFDKEPVTEPRMFILMAEVGAVGLNLGKAKRVFKVVYDWNPAADAQREARARRLGYDGVRVMHPVIFRDPDSKQTLFLLCLQKATCDKKVSWEEFLFHQFKNEKARFKALLLAIQNTYKQADLALTKALSETEVHLAILKTLLDKVESSVTETTLAKIVEKMNPLKQASTKPVDPLLNITGIGPTAGRSDCIASVIQLLRSTSLWMNSPPKDLKDTQKAFREALLALLQSDAVSSPGHFGRFKEVLSQLNFMDLSMNVPDAALLLKTALEVLGYPLSIQTTFKSNVKGVELKKTEVANTRLLTLPISAEIDSLQSQIEHYFQFVKSADKRPLPFTTVDGVRVFVSEYEVCPQVQQPPQELLIQIDRLRKNSTPLAISKEGVLNLACAFGSTHPILYRIEGYVNFNEEICLYTAAVLRNGEWIHCDRDEVTSQPIWMADMGSAYLFSLKRIHSEPVHEDPLEKSPLRLKEALYPAHMTILPLPSASFETAVRIGRHLQSAQKEKIATHISTKLHEDGLPLQERVRTAYQDSQQTGNGAQICRYVQKFLQECQTLNPAAILAQTSVKVFRQDATSPVHELTELHGTLDSSAPPIHLLERILPDGRKHYDLIFKF